MNDPKSQTDYEQLREFYKPKEIRVLFIGESRPYSGKFFYREDSILYNAIYTAFGCPNDFLELFKNQGFYLEDLIPYPVNQLRKTEQQKKKRECERIKHREHLADRLHIYRPDYIIIVMKDIKKHIIWAMQSARLSVPYYTLPFPWNEHYFAQFVQILKAILAKENLYKTNE